MDLIYLALLTFVASLIGTVTGFGISTLMIPILVIFLPPVETIFFVAIIHWFGDLWKVLLFGQGFHWKLIILFGLIGLAASYVGAAVSLGTDHLLLLRILGVFLVVDAVFMIYKPRLEVRADNSHALLGGALSGFFAGMFGMGGPIRSAFLSLFALPKAVHLATIGAIGLMVDSTRIITYWRGGVVLPETLWWALLVLIPASFLGAELAKGIVDQIPQKKFRLVIAVFLLLIGLKLLFWPSILD